MTPSKLSELLGAPSKIDPADELGTAEPSPEGAPAGISPEAGPEPRKGPGRPKGCKCPQECPVHPEKAGEPPRKRRRDPAPKTRPKPKGGSSPTKQPPTSEELEASLAELLSLPAIPAAAFLNCGYCAGHFATQGPATARELVRLSEENPAFRRALIRLHEAVTAITYGGVIAGYIGKPLLHHLAPAHMVQTVGPLVGVPPRPESHAKPAPASRRTTTADDAEAA